MTASFVYCPECSHLLGEFPDEIPNGFVCDRCGWKSEQSTVIPTITSTEYAKKKQDSDFAEVCRRCKWWFQYAEGSFLSYFGGECRRHAPTDLQRQGIKSDVPFEEARKAIHPSTDSNHWCGDWEWKGKVD